MVVKTRHTYTDRKTGTKRKGEERQQEREMRQYYIIETTQTFIFIMFP